MGFCGNEEYIIVSQKAQDFIDIPEGDEDDHSLFIEEDVISRSLLLIKENQEQQVLLLFFVTPKELRRIETYLSSLGKKTVLYRVALVQCVEHLNLTGPIEDKITAVRSSRVTAEEFLFLIRSGFRSMKAELAREKEESEHTLRLMDAWNDQESLIHIGKSLSLEKDPDKLLRTILYLSKKITGADAGSLYIVERDGDRKYLRFKFSHTFSKNLSYEEFTMPMDTKSIAGYVAVTGQVLNLEDVYKLDSDAPVSFNPTFDKEHGYRTKSMLVLPMRNHIDEIIGVIQLINSKETGEMHTGNEAFEVRLETDKDFELKVCPFKERYENLMEAIAGQAAIAMENNRMLIQIEHQFEEFVKASVTAIESRDPATSGHSFRIAEMSVRTAKALNDSQEEPFRDIMYTDVQLKEIEFAGLLHDFGKVYLDPSIFLKSKKLFPRDYQYLMMRLNFLYRSLELEFEHEKLAKKIREERLENLRGIMNTLAELNEPRVQDTDPEQIIEAIVEKEKQLFAADLEGKPIPILEQPEITNLKIKRGSLNDEERKIIESHVEHTYAFVSKIPWPDEYKNIPEIARKHHEKLDGTGYPQGLKGTEELPVASRIMAIADIFDALSATDRPYKRAVPADRIFAILREEADAGKLDKDIVELFISSGSWKLEPEKQV